MAYWRSGQLGDRATRRIAMILCAATLVGIPVGIVINTRLSHDGFGLLLGIFAAAIGLLVCYRQRQRVDTQRPNVGVAVPELHDAATALVGICVGAASTQIGRESCRERVCPYV